MIRFLKINLFPIFFLYIGATNSTILAQNHITLENQKEGTLSWQLERPATKREIEGYASSTSANKGEEIHFFVNTKAKEYQISVFRMGWYGGNGARLVFKSPKIKGLQQEIPLPNATTGMVECDWKNPYTLETSKEWTTGVYLAKLEELDTQRQSYIIFVLRDDTMSPDVLFQLPVTTYQAYNFWGGKSLYDWASGSNTDWGNHEGQHADKVSFNRPYVASNNPKAASGMGAGDFLTNVSPVTNGYPISSAGWDYNMVRWLEKNGYNLGYITNIDTHTSPNLLLKSKVFLSQGHDEYWTGHMRRNVEGIRDKGVNLAFFASNAVYWQIRLEPGTNGKENRTIVCYKEPERDPIQGADTTTNFREAPVNNPEASLLGVQYINDPVTGDITISNANHWAYKGTNLKNGDRLKGLVGYESDALHERSPKNIEVLATSKSINLYKSNISYIWKQNVDLVQSRILNLLNSKLSISQKLGKLLLKLTVFACALVFLALAYGLTKFSFKIGLLFVCGSVLAFLLLFWLRVKSFNAKYAQDFDSHMTIYETNTGSKVFATGSMQWSWGLDDYNSPDLRVPYRNADAQTITKNILANFGADPNN